MSKVVNLTESDLVRLVKRIMVEQTMNSPEYDSERKKYNEFLKSALQQLGTNDAYEALNPDPTKILMDIINRTNKLLELYKKTPLQKQITPKKNTPPTKPEPKYGLETGRRAGIKNF